MIDKINKVINSQFISQSNTELIITETESNATINRVTFRNSNFININPNIISYLNTIFSEEKLCKGYSLCDELTFQQKCDGIFLINNENNWYICICELKSNLNQENFLKAKAQLEVSLLKILTIFDCFEPIENFRILSFIVSQLPQNNTEEKLKQIRNRNTDKKSPAQIAYQKLILNKACLIEDNTCLLNSFHIKDRYLLKNNSINFIEGNNCIIDILSYIN